MILSLLFHNVHVRTTRMGVLSHSLPRLQNESGCLPAKVSMPGVEACLNVGLGGVMRASRGDPMGCGVFMALCMALAPFAIWAKPGEGTCWSEACGCGEEVIC